MGQRNHNGKDDRRRTRAGAAGRPLSPDEQAALNAQGADQAKGWKIGVKLRDGRELFFSWPHRDPPRQVILQTPPIVLAATCKNGELICSPIQLHEPVVRLTRGLDRPTGEPTYRQD